MTTFLSYIYAQACLAPESLWGKLKAKCFWHLRYWLLSQTYLQNFPVSMYVYGETLSMPLSHNLPLMLADKPLYDSLLKRIVDHLRQRDGFVSLVDVGANIGDTVIACRLEPGDTALSIEPNPVYWPYLQLNLQLCKGRTMSAQSLVGCVDKIMSVSATTAQGTACYTKKESGESVQVRTIPSLMSAAGMKHCNFLKIDTDGHDFDCLKGAASILQHSQPAVLFEADCFLNENYGKELISIVSMLIEMRYTLFMLYTNDGYLFGFYTSESSEELYKAAFYQTLSKKLYFDILALPSSLFLASELEYFVNIEKDPSRSRTAHNIASAMMRSSGA
jgi:FkbM family methyltransferase